jgi:hypothetical protein
MDCSFIAARNYPLMLHNIPEDRRTQPQRGETLKISHGNAFV